MSRMTFILSLLTCMTACNTTPPPSSFVGNWVLSPAATTQPFFLRTRGVQLALNPNGSAIFRAVILDRPTTAPAAVTGEIHDRERWTQTSPTTAELYSVSANDPHRIRLEISGDKLLISRDKSSNLKPGQMPDVELTRDR